jgi:hypothetical protein
MKLNENVKFDLKSGIIDKIKKEVLKCKKNIEKENINKKGDISFQMLFDENGNDEYLQSYFGTAIASNFGILGGKLESTPLSSVFVWTDLENKPKLVIYLDRDVASVFCESKSKKILELLYELCK